VGSNPTLSANSPLDVFVFIAEHARMAETPPADPFAFFRQMVSQWENMANDYGTQIAGSPGFAQGMQTATAASAKVQQAANDAMAKALAAANMPSRGDIDAIGARLATIEAQLGRIEARLSHSDANGNTSSSSRPKRTKQPPPKT
jgi:hypothetical protein